MGRWAPPPPHQEADSSRCWGPRGPEARVQLPCGDPEQEPMSCRSRSALLSSEPSLRLKPQDTRPHPRSTRASSWGTPALAPHPCETCPPLKDRHSLHRGRREPSTLSPFAVECLLTCVVVRKCTAGLFLCLPELCARGVDRPTERRKGHHPVPKQLLHGHCKAHTADVPTCLPGAARRQSQDPTNYTVTQSVPHGPGGCGTE